MAPLRVGFIGMGRRKARPDITGFSMAYAHADGYRALPDRCGLVACADIARENTAARSAPHPDAPIGDRS